MGIIIKKGEEDWWLYNAMLHVAQRERKKFNIAAGGPVTLSIDDINHFLDTVRSNFCKRAWYILTKGDFQQRDIDELGDKLILKTSQGDLLKYEKEEVMRERVNRP